MKKQASPAPTPRAAALSQSASQFSAGATSAWQHIAGNSPRLAAASHRGPGATRVAAPLAPPAAPGAGRVALEPQRAAEQIMPATGKETIRQVGWREVDRAVSMSTKRKYTLFGFEFGPKVPVFETEKVKLPVYQETDRNKLYYAAVKQEDIARIKREGFRAKTGEKETTPKTIEQFNSRGCIYFFDNEAGARTYGQQMAIDYVIVKFVLPEYQGFIPEPKASVFNKSDGTHVLSTFHTIPVSSIKKFDDLSKYTS